jgi:hypothetical protein
MEPMTATMRLYMMDLPWGKARAYVRVLIATLLGLLLHTKLTEPGVWIGVARPGARQETSPMPPVLSAKIADWEVGNLTTPVTLLLRFLWSWSLI